MADEAEFSDDWIADLPSSSANKKTNKKLSVERIYQKKSQLEHILLRPDTYIGSVEPVTQSMWVFDEGIGMNSREVTFVPGLYKIFDEILVNAADNKQRDKSMNCIKINIDPGKNSICIWNNGQGIPVVEHKDEKMFVPSLIFGHLLTSSNYNDEERKVTGGRNGYGAKLCNIFSTEFTVETASKDFGKEFKQTWTDNMSKTENPKISPIKARNDFTCITFYPDLAKFKMAVLDQDIVALMVRRAYDIAGCSPGVGVFLNDIRLPIKNFKDYIELYLENERDEVGSPLKVIHEKVDERWEVAITLSDHGFQQVSFVNSIATTKGGRHVDYITDQLTSRIAEAVKKKNKGGKDVKSFQIKSHLWVFVNCLIENPTFDSQTKENMTLQVKKFGSKCQLTAKFIAETLKTGVVESIMSWVQFSAQTELQKKCSGKKHSKLKGIPKLEDANDAGTKKSIDCTLILTEGDSAKTLAVSGLGVVGRDKYGVFPLKGKMLNVREATHKQILENAEINNIIKIIGLQYKKKYETVDDLKTLRYGRLMVMTDQDQDGSHIKGLLINFIHHNWPSLLRLPFLEEFITPIVKATKGKEEKSFYSLPEFEEWKRDAPNWPSYKIKYYKGLGTSTAKEAKEYFSDMSRHRIKFQYKGTDDDNAIQLAFSKKMVDMRKEWLISGMDERKRRRELGLPELYLYGKDTKRVSYCDFVNKELILFSNMDNERSIPSMVDGMKPGQRKIIFTCLKRNDKREVKVAQLAGSVAEHSAYHHGEVSLTGTIVNLAQNFVGSNNINLLQPIGQFGTRLQGGKDSASPRYIFTMLSPLTRHLFSSLDTPILNHQYDDNLKIEPEYYVPIIPMVLVNGAEGIGTGWSTKIPNYNPRDLVKNLLSMLDGEDSFQMIPYFKNFRGTVEHIDNHHFLVSGEIALLENNQIEITELPIKTWTQSYKEAILEPMLYGTDKTPPFITDYKEYNTDTTVRFIVSMAPDKLQHLSSESLHKVFKLQATINLTSMVLFDHLGCIKKYDSPDEMLKEFYGVRLTLYEQRKKYMVGFLEAECLKLKNQARFILEKIENKIVIENRKKLEMIKTLQDRGYDSDPMKAWKKSQQNEDSDTEQDGDATGPDYDYLLGMSLWSLTFEKKDELLKKRDEKIKELEDLKLKTPSELWKIDLQGFMDELDAVEKKEKEEAADQPKSKGKLTAKDKRNEDTKPSRFGERVIPSVNEEIKKKFEKKTQILTELKKRRKKDTEENEDGTKIVPLTERLKSPMKDKKGNIGKGMKQTTLSFPATGKGKKEPHTKGLKRGKKNMCLSDSESDVLDGLSYNDIVSERREIAPRKAAVNKAKYIENDDDENMESPNTDSDVDSPSNFSKNKVNNFTNDSQYLRDGGGYCVPLATDKTSDLLSTNSSSAAPTETQTVSKVNYAASDGHNVNKKCSPKKRGRKNNASSDHGFKPVKETKKAAPKKGDRPKKPRARNAKKAKISDSSDELKAEGNRSFDKTDPRPKSTRQHPDTLRTEMIVNFSDSSDSD